MTASEILMTRLRPSKTELRRRKMQTPHTVSGGWSRRTRRLPRRCSIFRSRARDTGCSRICRRTDHFWSPCDRCKAVVCGSVRVRRIWPGPTPIRVGPGAENTDCQDTGRARVQARARTAAKKLRGRKDKETEAALPVVIPESPPGSTDISGLSIEEHETSRARQRRAKLPIVIPEVDGAIEHEADNLLRASPTTLCLRGYPIPAGIIGHHRSAVELC